MQGSRSSNLIGSIEITQPKTGFSAWGNTCSGPLCACCTQQLSRGASSGAWHPGIRGLKGPSAEGPSGGRRRVVSPHPKRARIASYLEANQPNGSRLQRPSHSGNPCRVGIESATAHDAVAMLREHLNHHHHPKNVGIAQRDALLMAQLKTQNATPG